MPLKIENGTTPCGYWISNPYRYLPFSSRERVVLGQSKVDFALGHRSRQHMRSLNSPLKSIVNAFLNGQLGLTA